MGSLRCYPVYRPNKPIPTANRPQKCPLNIHSVTDADFANTKHWKQNTNRTRNQNTQHSSCGKCFACLFFFCCRWLSLAKVSFVGIGPTLPTLFGHWLLWSPFMIGRRWAARARGNANNPDLGQFSRFPHVSRNTHSLPWTRIEAHYKGMCAWPPSWAHFNHCPQHTKEGIFTTSNKYLMVLGRRTVIRFSSSSKIGYLVR